MKRTPEYLFWNRKYHCERRKLAYERIAGEMAELRRLRTSGAETAALVAKLTELENAVALCLEHSQAAIFGLKHSMRHGTEEAGGATGRILAEELLLQDLLEEKINAVRLLRAHAVNEEHLEAYMARLKELKTSGSEATAAGRILNGLKKMQKAAKKEFLSLVDVHAERSALGKDLFRRIEELDPRSGG